MTDASAFTKLVPGFDFLQNLVKGAGTALPGIGQWVAPTIDPDEIDKRIKELRTVQYWLEQNTRMLEATIQALEVQRMTLSTLKTMNVQMDDLRESMKIKAPAAAPAAQAAEEPEPEAEAEPEAAAAPAAPPAPGAVDPMQWWGALTKQFTELATSAMKDTGTDAAKTLAGALMKQSIDAAGQPAAKARRPAAKTAAKKKPAARKKATPTR
ncbi:MAG: PhaM family polyhydroxyalkanoate granule multifunctional regulatory protein [Burkholderiales bacterium]